MSERERERRNRERERVKEKYGRKEDRAFTVVLYIM